MAYNKTTIEKIAAQALQEIQTARTHKQGKIGYWQKNEEMYYGVKRKSETSRSQVQLSRMQEFVHTLLSKVDNPLTFKFTKRKNSQLKRVAMLNALKDQDKQIDMWDIKDIAVKKQAIIYGRGIFNYYADSVNKMYKAHLEPVDVYDFLIDPKAGGLDIERGRYMGAYDVVLDRRMLKTGAKSGAYRSDGVKELLDGSGNAGEMTQEEINKNNRVYDQNTWTNTNISIQDPSVWKFWRWFTTYQEDGYRYYLLMTNSGQVIRCERLDSILLPTEDHPLGMFPFWSYAAFPDLTEFWTPSYCDYARDIFMTQDVSIGQMLDNAESINKPMRVVNVSLMDDMNSLKYRRDGVIKVKGDFDVNRAYQVVNTPSINTPIQVFNLLESIQEKASGVTALSKGVADDQGTLGIYEGNKEAAADRFGLFNKSYSFGYNRFAKLYELGVRQNLIKKTAIELIGPDGIEQVEIKNSDIFRSGDQFGALVESSDAQMMASGIEKKQKLDFLAAQAQNKEVNPKKAFEVGAKIAGFNEDEIAELMDTSYYGNSELMSECDRDIERLLDNDSFDVNQLANNAYKQKMVHYMRDHQEDMTEAQFGRFVEYIDSLEDIIMRNEARNLQNEIIDGQKLGEMDFPGAEGQMEGEVPPIEGAPAPLQEEPPLAE